VCRDEYTKMQQDLEQTASAVSKLEEENTLLKKRTSQAVEADVEAADPLAGVQVRLEVSCAAVVARAASLGGRGQC
jgi:hypothetical protein